MFDGTIATYGNRKIMVKNISPTCMMQAGETYVGDYSEEQQSVILEYYSLEEQPCCIFV